MLAFFAAIDAVNEVQVILDDDVVAKKRSTMWEKELRMNFRPFPHRRQGPRLRPHRDFPRRFLLSRPEDSWMKRKILHRLQVAIQGIPDDGARRAIDGVETGGIQPEGMGNPDEGKGLSTRRPGSVPESNQLVLQCGV